MDNTYTQEYLQGLPVEYIEGDSLAFKAFIDPLYLTLPARAELVGIDGKNRWLITREDGTQYIARPAETNEKNS